MVKILGPCSLKEKRLHGKQETIERYYRGAPLICYENFYSL